MFDLNPLDKSTAIIEILILMLIAAIIGFVIAWLYWRRKVRHQMELLQAKHNDCAVRLRELESKHAAALKANQSLSNELADGTAKLTFANSEIENLKKRLHQGQTEREALEANCQEWESEVNRLKAALAAKENEITAFTGNLAQDQNAAEEMRRALEKTTAAKDAATSQLSAAKAEIADLKAALDRQQTAANSLKGKLDEAEMAQEVCAGKLGSAEAEIAALKSKASSPQATEKDSAGSKEDKQAGELEKIRAKRELINFDRIGTASFETRDDLKIISGIGPFIEKKLNALGIYTFAQISRFTKEDVESVTKAIEFFPGRIERDNWVGQASKLAQG